MLLAGRIWNYLGYGPLGMHGTDYLGYVTNWGREIYLLWVAPLPDWSPELYKHMTGTEKHIFIPSLFIFHGCNVLSCLKLLKLWAICHDGLYLKLRDKATTPLSICSCYSINHNFKERNQDKVGFNPRRHPLHFSIIHQLRIQALLCCFMCKETECQDGWRKDCMCGSAVESVWQKQAP